MKENIIFVLKYILKMVAALIFLYFVHWFLWECYYAGIPM
jgi:hypothetical protein